MNQEEFPSDEVQITLKCIPMSMHLSSQVSAQGGQLTTDQAGGYFNGVLKYACGPATRRQLWAVAIAQLREATEATEARERQI